MGYRHILLSGIVFALLSSLDVDQSTRSRAIAGCLLVVSSLTEVPSFFIQIDRVLLGLAWEFEPASIHAYFYTELLLPLAKRLLLP